MRSRNRVRVISSSIDVIGWDEILNKLLSWSRSKESKYVCICNVHSVVTAGQDVILNGAINRADLATPDGAPVAWVLRRKGNVDQERINGPDLMWRYCFEAEREGESIFLYGGRQEALHTLERVLLLNFPRLKIAGSYSPPFSELSEEEDERIVNLINKSGAGTVWVSLGCPKQEKWMSDHKGRVNATMIGVGAAFDYHAGTVKRAPLWMQNNSLEWLYRLCSEPFRLWRRYFSTNSAFVIYVVKDFFRL